MRPREFDTEQALDTIMSLFWSRGYEATSMRDVVAATGVHKASLYAAFGNKQTMFERSLDRYIDTVVIPRLERMRSARRARDGIESFIRAIVDAATSGGAYWGCLMVNTGVEVACHERSVTGRLDRNYQRLQRAFTECAERAQREGDIPADRDPAAVARFLITGAFGLHVLARSLSRGAVSRANRAVLDDAAGGIVAALD